MSADVETMVRDGINAFKAGNKDEARALLIKATELDERNEQAWLWLSGLMESVTDQRTCLENVLAINPDNERAKQGLSYLGGQPAASSPSPYAPPSSAPPAAPSPTSVEWGTPSSSPPSAPGPTDSGQSVGPDWVKNLNLQTNKAQNQDADSPFGGFDFDNVDLDADFGGPFGSSALEADTAEAPARRSRRTRRAKLPRDSEPPRKKAEPEGVEPLFGNIPREIKATRLPGTHERTPLLLTVGLIVLIVLNIGAASLLMISLMT